MAIDGIRSGCTEALASALDQPVTGVDIYIEEVTFDYTYSTEAVFHVVAREAVSQLLMQAKSEGKLEVQCG